MAQSHMEHMTASSVTMRVQGAILIRLAEGQRYFLSPLSHLELQVLRAMPARDHLMAFLMIQGGDAWNVLAQEYAHVSTGKRTVNDFETTVLKELYC